MTLSVNKILQTACCMVNAILFSGNKVRLAFIDTVVKPPREVRRQQLRHGTVGMVRGRSGPSSANSSSSSSTGRFEDHGSGSSLGSSHFHQHNRCRFGHLCCISLKAFCLPSFPLLENV